LPLFRSARRPPGKIVLRRVPCPPDKPPRRPRQSSRLPLGRKQAPTAPCRAPRRAARARARADPCTPATRRPRGTPPGSASAAGVTAIAPIEEVFDQPRDLAGVACRGFGLPEGSAPPRRPRQLGGSSRTLARHLGAGLWPFSDFRRVACDGSHL